MSLDLDTVSYPIDQDDDTYKDVLEDLQGGILNGHGRDHAVHIFISFKLDKIQEVKQWISNFASTKITSAKKQLDAAREYESNKTDAGVFASFSISVFGYDGLGIPKEQQPLSPNQRERDETVPDRFGNPAPFYTDAYQAGMKSRQSVLLDSPVDTWNDGYRGPIDALIILAADDPAELIANERDILSQLQEIANLKTIERGLTLRRKFEATVGSNPLAIEQEFGSVVEHFGYADGVSQPLFLKKNVERVQAKTGANRYWNPAAPLKLVLIDDCLGTPGVSFGSFLVFRKLEQNVQGFKKAEAELAKALGLPEELAGAMAVGRYEDGTPLVLQPGNGGWAKSNVPVIPNDFNYDGDLLGLTCPFQAHIRKSNPRLESVNKAGPFATSDEEELGHRIARRGITYGGPLSTSDDLDSLPTQGVGLLFMCYQADIWEQFEFIQRLWCNNPVFLKPGLRPDINYDRTGLDAVIGQKQGEQFDPVIGEVPQPPQNWPIAWGNPTTKPQIESQYQFAQFVTLKGGEYFFSPSITALKQMANN